MGVIPEARQWGAYYTSTGIASYLAHWAIRDREDRVLEPSFGDGVFLDVSLDRLRDLGSGPANLFAVEIRPEPFHSYRGTGMLLDSNCFLGDFLRLDPFPVKTVIGNPPYIRLRDLERSAAESARRATLRAGVSMAGSGSLWMPFVVHATSFLEAGGRIAFVLPIEMTYVKYALPLWNYLAREFASIRIVRIHEDVFPENEQSTVLLLADGYGHSTDSVCFETYLTADDLEKGRVLRRVSLLIESIRNGERPFSRALLSSSLVSMLHELKVSGKIDKISRWCRFNIGYVSGDKAFFHPTQDMCLKFSLPSSNLRPAVVSSRQLRGAGIYVREGDIRSSLYYPSSLSSGDEAYIRQGVSLAVHNRYKCRTREPWYLTPDVEIPEIVLSTFAESPLLAVNEGQYVASNSLLCGFMETRVFGPERIAMAWYNSLTLLSVELQVHSLGGGVLILIPGEANQIHIPSPTLIGDSPMLLSLLDQALRREAVDEARRLGDEMTLGGALGLTTPEVALLREGVEELRWWRNAFKLPPRDVATNTD